MARMADLVIVGAGPAGLSAALEARRLGVDTVVLDEFPHPGGQYYKQPWVAPGEHDRQLLSPQVQEGADLIASVRELGVPIWSNTTVWGLFPAGRLGIDRGGQGEELTARHLLIATGAHDRTMAFPGWTLPGVITPGAAQTLAKSQAVCPGRRVVLAGSGPFLLVVAKQLLDLGVEIAAYVEAARWNWGALAGIVRFPGRWRELAVYASALRRNRVPMFLGHAVIRAEGDRELEAVTVAPLDPEGRPVEDGCRRIEAETLAVAYGFRVASELTSIAGCAHEFDERRGGRYCRVDPSTGRTSIETIYAAGEVTGFAGAAVAREEGRIAGLCAARSLGAWDGEAERRLVSACRRRVREQSFADLVNRTFAPPARLAAMITDDTVLCRCEEVSAAAVREAVAAGARSVGAVKMWTRCGMGRCQGRICGWTLGRHIVELTGRSLADVGVNEPRIPAKPVVLSRVLEGADAP